MIDVHLQAPDKVKGIPRARNLRMPIVGEPVVVYYNDVKISKGKVIAVDTKKHTYGIELTKKEGNP